MINFIGIGAQKCASSWIYEVLNNTEQSCLAETKELNFFSHYYDKGFEWYESQFTHLNKPIVGEISPSYFYDSDTPARLAKYNPEVKIVLSLREPMKRMFSNHLHEVRERNISGLNRTFENGFNNNPLYFEQSCYSTHLKKWLTYFDRRQLHVIFQEDVRKSPIEVSNRLCEFLGIDKIPFTEVNTVNESLQNKNELLGKAFNFGGEILRNLGLKSSLNKLKNSRLLGALHSQNKVHISSLVPPINIEFECYLKTLLKPYDDELKAMLDVKKLPWDPL
jgi:hypothetical protein